MSHDTLNTHRSTDENEKSTQGQKLAKALAIAGFAATTVAASSSGNLSRHNVLHYFNGNEEDRTVQLQEAEQYDEYITITAESDGTRYDAVRQAYPKMGTPQVYDLVWSTVNVTAEEENRADKHTVQAGDQVDVPKVDVIVTD